jgi:hypothetical protein
MPTVRTMKAAVAQKFGLLRVRSDIMKVGCRMPFLLQADERTRIFHVRAIDLVSDADLTDLRDRLNHEDAFVTGWPILCDCSAIAGLSISSSLIESLAKTARMRHNLVAIIAPKAAAFGLARMYQILSDPEYERIQVFAKTSEATAWLNAEIKGTSLHERESHSLS